MLCGVPALRCFNRIVGTDGSGCYRDALRIASKPIDKQRRRRRHLVAVGVPARVVGDAPDLQPDLHDSLASRKELFSNVTSLDLSSTHAINSSSNIALVVV